MLKDGEEIEDCIRNDKPVLVNGVEGAKGIATCAACWESIKTGRPAQVLNAF